MEFPTSDFWSYSSQIWAMPDVETTCLELQNDFDADVNLLIFCIWLGDTRRCMNEDDLQMLLDTVKPWQTMIKPLRDSRKMMQQQMIAMPTHLIEQTISNMKEMELNAEHMAQLALEKALTHTDVQLSDELSEVECSLANLNLYLHCLEAAVNSGEATTKISQLLTAVYQDEESVQMALMNQAAAG